MGGEKRGMESAALVVVRPGGGYGGNHDRWLGLRVDYNEQPIEALAALVELHTLYFGASDPRDRLDFDEALREEVREILRALDWLRDDAELEESLFAWLGWHNLEERWLGMEKLDPVVLRELRATKKDSK